MVSGKSPSSWAEWVEINVHCSVKNPLFSLRPRGRSGLKFLGYLLSKTWVLSPSSWAEWVEMLCWL